jgi:hypothetical protein
VVLIGAGLLITATSLSWFTLHEPEGALGIGRPDAVGLVYLWLGALAAAVGLATPLRPSNARVMGIVSLVIATIADFFLVADWSYLRDAIDAAPTQLGGTTASLGLGWPVAAAGAAALVVAGIFLVRE